MRHSHQLALAASVGAVIGFTLVVLVLTDNALTWSPLILVPTIATDWKARCTVMENAAELQQFLLDFYWDVDAAICAPRQPVLAFQRRLRQRPRLTRHQRHHVDQWTASLFQPREAA